MIVTFTDFGREGPYLGQMEAVLAHRAPRSRVIHLQTDAPAFRPQAAACLLRSLLAPFPPGCVFLCVVDPGVGTLRRPLVLRAGTHWFVGPDNGLLIPAVRSLGVLGAWVVHWRPHRLSDSFHGRDLFAPVAAMLANGEPVPGDIVEVGDLQGWGWPEVLWEVVYVDVYGNVMTGIPADLLGDEVILSVAGEGLPYCRVFGEAAAGVVFWYRNAMGLVEIAVNRGSAAKRLGLQVGSGIECRA
ncbi:SAM hydrolase/SAM-dependent halogenase family protein [Ectothiorhodospira lacustris]|uniref:SAM hydrolase/SAM-dependent halogenase family protein n=1 Tax=Ectothiorhodospira lacustris TaxID=2899127 RepID=UPI001EE8D525|nr:SAM-dependent chlorinase/fluorinase [Ectothiorhodospira lacustris]MCG5499441.1 SAM-dependent chlorinase/fluorinase [Ectothiorhodospira lacustris]MCG5510414.1 SAM-dependent chlorinase/fluorinase [Ectothiorhodospira lacustris]MCG5522160.1 SAM-dependent chlorinase/fluorinase [Ectothiorhodospira lacustris]